MLIPTNCTLCPRRCGADRRVRPGVCLGGGQARVSNAAPHFGEERCISGTRGSGTVFFAGCGLRCVFCQNHTLRDALSGRPTTISQLAEMFLSLAQQGTHNLNLVTPTHYRPWIQQALAKARQQGFSLPVVWNTSGYETEESICSLEEDVAVWLFDLKFYDPALGQLAAGAPDYFSVAFAALQQVYAQTGPPVFDREGLLTRGVVVRLLVLPGYTEDAVQLVEQMAAHLPVENIVLSLMRQYRPPYGLALPGSLGRALRLEEYTPVVQRATALGFSSQHFQ